MYCFQLLVDLIVCKRLKEALLSIELDHFLDLVLLGLVEGKGFLYVTKLSGEKASCVLERKCRLSSRVDFEKHVCCLWNPTALINFLNYKSY